MILKVVDIINIHFLKNILKLCACANSRKKPLSAAEKALDVGQLMYHGYQHGPNTQVVVDNDPTSVSPRLGRLKEKCYLSLLCYHHWD